MKTLFFILGILLPIFSYGQTENEDHVTVSERKDDDIYYAGETINVVAPVFGDVVLAGSDIRLNDTIHQDLLVAGGKVSVTGFVADDIRAAAGILTIDSEVGDDVIVAGGRVIITENAVIHGNLINYSGNIEMNGLVMGMVRSSTGKMTLNGTVEGDANIAGENIKLNGEIKGKSRLTSENLEIGDNAKFHQQVTYWNDNGEVDFKNALVGTTAEIDETLITDDEEISWRGFGLTAFWFWMLYLPSTFLMLLLMNWLLHRFFSRAALDWDKKILRSLGYGFIYILGVPIMILISFLIIIGIPIGLFMTFLYIFSLIFGHLVTALLLSYYLDHKQETRRKPLPILLIALLFAAIFRLLTFIPAIGILIAILINAIGYGLFVSRLFKNKHSLRLAE